MAKIKLSGDDVEYLLFIQWTSGMQIGHATEDSIKQCKSLCQRMFITDLGNSHYELSPLGQMIVDRFSASEQEFELGDD